MTCGGCNMRLRRLQHALAEVATCACRGCNSTKSTSRMVQLNSCSPNGIDRKNVHTLGARSTRTHMQTRITHRPYRPTHRRIDARTHAFVRMNTHTQPHTRARSSHGARARAKTHARTPMRARACARQPACTSSQQSVAFARLVHARAMRVMARLGVTSTGWHGHRQLNVRASSSLEASR